MKQHCKRVKAEATDILRPASEITVNFCYITLAQRSQSQPRFKGRGIRHDHSRAQVAKKLQPSQSTQLSFLSHTYVVFFCFVFNPMKSYYFLKLDGLGS